MNLIALVGRFYLSLEVDSSRTHQIALIVRLLHGRRGLWAHHLEERRGHELAMRLFVSDAFVLAVASGVDRVWGEGFKHELFAWRHETKGEQSNWEGKSALGRSFWSPDVAEHLLSKKRMIGSQTESVSGQPEWWVFLAWRRCSASSIELLWASHILSFTRELDSVFSVLWDFYNSRRVYVFCHWIYEKVSL